MKNRTDRKVNRIGEEHITKEGYKIRIVEYSNALNISVMFSNGHIKNNVQYSKVLSGSVRNPFHKSVFTVGYIGVGKHKANENGKLSRKYIAWHNMISRCYNPKYHLKYPTYTDCIVCGEWHNYQSFGDWYDKNYYEIKGEKMCLDKDILMKGNKIYSPNTCVFIPNEINVLLTKSNKSRGKYPIGVSYNKNQNKYISICQNQLIKKSEFLGYYNTPKEAFYVYKEYKENHIKEVANYYKDCISCAVYNALYNYKVEITD